MSEKENIGVSPLSDETTQPDVAVPKDAVRPIVLEYKKIKKKKDQVGIEDKNEGKEKYSKGLEDIQRLEGDMVHISQKAAKALSKGIDVYEKERYKSAKEKTNGAIKDFINNSAKATSTYLKEASDIPVDLAESISTSSYRKRLRKNLRRVSGFLRVWRI